MTANILISFLMRKWNVIIMGGGLVEVFGLDFIGYGVCPALVLHFLLERSVA